MMRQVIFQEMTEFLFQFLKIGFVHPHGVVGIESDHFYLVVHGFFFEQQNWLKDSGF
jgi:hypothetical protein